MTSEQIVNMSRKDVGGIWGKEVKEDLIEEVMFESERIPGKTRFSFSPCALPPYPSLFHTGPSGPAAPGFQWSPLSL